MAGVFEGVRVLDLSWGSAGPMTTMLLADNGAEVIRIEPPDGDRFDGQSGYRVWNRGKQSARLDLTSDEGHRVFERLAEGADVVVESFSPGVARRLRVDHERVSVRNPQLISCSISGYGRHENHRNRPGYDALVTARTGLLFDHKGRRGTSMEYIRGRSGPHPDFDPPEGLVRGADRRGPVFPRTPWPSIGAAYFATLGIAAALRARAVTGQGQHVETSLLQGALAGVCLNWQRVEDPDAPLYWTWPSDGRAIDGLYQCADGRWVHHWTVRPHWVLSSADGESAPTPPPMDGAYRDDPDRMSMDADGFLAAVFLHPLLEEAFRTFTSDQWVRASAAAGMGMAPVRSPAEALSDPSFLGDGCVVEVEDPDLGRVRYLGPLLEFSETPGSVRGPAPSPGEHTHRVVASGSRKSKPTREGGSALDHPLAGIRVLDLGLGVAGPFAGRVLADLGADVIKVDAVDAGFWNGTHMGLATNRGKRSIAVDLKSAEGAAVLTRMIERADVLMTNWRPGVAARLGIDFEALHARFPRLVYCNTRGFESGPRSFLPGTDQTAAALTGTEWADGATDAGNPPLRSRLNLIDTGSALLAAIAITAALFHREVTGRGQLVGTSLVNAGLLHTSYTWIHADGTRGDGEQVDADQYGLSAWYRLYECADDRWIFIAAVGDGIRQRLASLLSCSGLAETEETKAVAVLEETFRSDSARAWFDRLDRSGIPVEIVDEDFCRTLFDDPVARSNMLVSETTSRSVGRFEDPGLLVNFSSTPAVVQRGPCSCGEHTREILMELGYADDEIEQLESCGAVLVDEWSGRPTAGGRRQRAGQEPR